MDYTLEDNDNLINWKRYNLSDWKVQLDYDKAIDSWSYDESVNTFIVSGWEISSYLKSLINESCDMYYALYDEQLLGVTVVSFPKEDHNVSTIQYLVVDPALHGKGIGTRMICSIRDNPEFFSTKNFERNKDTVLETYVDVRNIRSQKAFLKNGFKVVKRPNDLNNLSGFYKFAYKEKPMEK